MPASLCRKLSLVTFAAMCLPGVALAQFEGKTCVPTPSATAAVPAPGSGSISIQPLSKFGLPAQVCATVGFSGTSISYDYTATLATTYQNASFPSACAGIAFGLNGGPTYSAISGKGNFAFNLANPTAAITGTLEATALSITENLTLSAGGQSFVINTGLLSYKSFVTINADKSVDIKVCTPKGGVPATVNGTNKSIPTNVWQCVAQPTAAQPNVRVTYQEGC
ncbi:MAG: hypothetical protein CFE44_15030 [Burkholderiales bacterium PBB4]|nr:MAG: hypothetical protein CFE44_15030 [Burkholderiales bacterium PBB4]